MDPRSPFASPEVGEIFAHMTGTEKQQVRRMVVGLLVALTWRMWVASLLAVLVLWRITLPGLSSPIAFWALTVMLWLAVSWRTTRARLSGLREFYCGTEWARQSGCTPDRLRLFVFPWQRRRVNRS